MSWWSVLSQETLQQGQTQVGAEGLAVTRTDRADAALRGEAAAGPWPTAASMLPDVQPRGLPAFGDHQAATHGESTVKRWAVATSIIPGPLHCIFGFCKNPPMAVY